MNSFSFEEYEQILDFYKSKIIDFSEVNKQKKSFCLIRHDVEFSLKKALEIAYIDKSKEVKSSFFFQLNNNFYNLLSSENIQIVKKIKNMGHNIGLHFYMSNIKQENFFKLIEAFNIQILIFRKIFGKIDRFSIHRPPEWVLKLKKNFYKNYINTYDKKYFEYCEKNFNPIKIKYFSDSNHNWTYGHPLDKHNYSKVQILIHPDEWSKKGSDHDQNIWSIIDEKKIDIIQTIKNEYKTFK